MFNMTQAEQDYLIVKSLIGDDLDRMSNLIIEMQKGYQTFFKESQKENRETISNLSSLVANQNSRKTFHNVASSLLCLQKISDNMNIQTHWLFDKLKTDLSKLKHTCETGCIVCDNALLFLEH